MLRIGVTGGIGSGKSIVCSIFERLGVPILFADQLARDISDNDPAVRMELTQLLSENAYRADGTLNRSYVASRLFSDRSIRKRVNAIVHPRVQKEIERRFELLEGRGERLAMIEAALIYEAGLEKILDAVIVVESNEKARVQRIVGRDGITAGEVRKRMKAQLDSKKKLQKADYVVRNNGSLQELETSVTFLYTLFVQLADGNSRG